MDLFAEWLATKHGMLDTLLSMVDAGEIAEAQSRTELLDAITTILDAGSAAGDLRADISADDIAASLMGIFAVAGRPAQRAQAERLLDLLMDGLRPSGSTRCEPELVSAHAQRAHETDVTTSPAWWE